MFSCSCAAMNSSLRQPRLVGVLLGQDVLEAGVEGGVGVGVGLGEGLGDVLGDGGFELVVLGVVEQALVAEALLVEGDRVAEAGLLGLVLGAVLEGVGHRVAA